MCGLYVKMPTTEDEWRLIAANFMHKWQFPNCIGALDGKLVVMTSPSNSDSLYFNYKGTMSMVLMAMVDADLKFTCIDIGGYGQNSDVGTFQESSLIPADAILTDAPEFGPLPYTIVADEAFPLACHIMRPYPGKSSDRRERWWQQDGAYTTVK